MFVLLPLEAIVLPLVVVVLVTNVEMLPAVIILVLTIVRGRGLQTV